MVTVKYNAESDAIALSRTTLADDIIERNFAHRLWSTFSNRKFQGTFLNDSF